MFQLPDPVNEGGRIEWIVDSLAIVLVHQQSNVLFVVPTINGRIHLKKIVCNPKKIYGVILTGLHTVQSLSR